MTSWRKQKKKNKKLADDARNPASSDQQFWGVARQNTASITFNEQERVVLAKLRVSGRVVVPGPEMVKVQIDGSDEIVEVPNDRAHIGRMGP